jgi:L-iditol 2-dehydrogenase
MKAANLYAPADIRVEQVPIPIPATGEVLIQVKGCGVCGSDISRLMETGTYSFPTIPGHEFSGIVAQLGADVSGVNVEDRVTVIPFLPCRRCAYCEIGEYQLCEDYSYLGSRTDGAYAEYVVAPATNLLPLPENVSFELGAMTDPAAVALHAVRKLGLRPGDSVAVFGVGPIGVFALEWAKAMGAGLTVAVDIFTEKLDIAAQLGADVCIDSRSDDPIHHIMALTAGRGVNRSVEFAGHMVTQEQSLLSTAKRGSIVWGGISHSPLPLQEKTVDAILRRELTLVGSWNSSFAHLNSDWATALQFMASGHIRGEEMISHRLPLEALPEAFRMLLAREEYTNKVMFFPEL